MPQASVVVLCALDEEAEPFLDLLETATWRSSGHRRWIEGAIDDQQVIVLPFAEMGNVASSVATQQAIALCSIVPQQKVPAMDGIHLLFIGKGSSFFQKRM